MQRPRAFIGLLAIIAVAFPAFLPRAGAAIVGADQRAAKVSKAARVSKASGVARRTTWTRSSAKAKPGPAMTVRRQRSAPVTKKREPVTPPTGAVGPSAGQPVKPAPVSPASPPTSPPSTATPSAPAAPAPKPSGGGAPTGSAAPLPPTGQIDVRSQYGTTDAALRQALGAAKAQGKTAYLSTGIYTYDASLVLDGVSVVGDGAGSVLRASNPGSSALTLKGVGASLRSISIQSPGARSRSGQPDAGGISVDRASNFVIDQVVVDTVSAAGILVVGGSNGTITGSTVRNTLSDGIHLTNGTHDVLVSGNTVTGTGDDMIAVVSYRGDGKLCENISIVGNTVRGQTWGRGITTLGGRNVLIQGNSIGDTAAAGILVTADEPWATYGTDGVRVIGNTISNTDNGHIQHGAIQLEGYAGQYVSNTTVEGNTISAAGYRGIAVNSYTRTTVVRGNRVSDVRLMEGIFVDGASDVSVLSNDIASTARYGVYVTRKATGQVVVNDNVIKDVNVGGDPAVDAINIETGSVAASGQIMRNRYSATRGLQLDRVVECFNSQYTVSGNSLT